MSNIIKAVLALAIAALASPAFAVATWEHFNADPAYQSREAAIADAPRVLRQVGYPEPVIALLVEAMKSPGVEAHVTNGMRFDFMRSGKSSLWRNVLVKFKKPPLEGNMEFAAPSEEWTVDWNGAKWTAGIPKVCNNIYGRRPATTPTAAPPRKEPPPAALPPVPGATARCPSGWWVHVNSWDFRDLPPGLRQEAIDLIAAAEARISGNATILAAYVADDVSGKLGRRLRLEVKKRAPIDSEVQVNLRDPKSGAVVQNLPNSKTILGEGDIPLTEAQYAMIVEVIFPFENVRSPTVSGGAHRLWSRPEERPNTCFTNVHSLGTFAR
jgi:hypothetical protein